VVFWETLAAVNPEYAIFNPKNCDAIF